ncbi:MAG: exo-beta-N-acetylmuramidase NamZ domain-containing protein [Bacteroidales bacterium]
MKTVTRHFFNPVITAMLAFALAGPLNGQNVATGVETLIKNNFEILKGKRVGLVTNPTGVDRSLRSTVDILHNAPEVNLVALYGPEHGVRGEFTAGEYVEFETDPSTGLPVYSLYGKTRKPSPEMLKDIDILVYDIQDIGSRSYTFISTLGLVMEAAAENGIPLVVLDRPNPLGGIRMEGAITRPGFFSFVSQFPIPYIHGVTVGELAMFLNGERLLSGGVVCGLHVEKMSGWKRSMHFRETGLPWVPSSPQVPHGDTPLYYPATGIAGELYAVSIGVGYTIPFQTFAAPWINADSLAAGLNKLKLPGVIFRPIHYKPYFSTLEGKMVHGVQIHITDPSAAPLTLLQFYIMQEAHRLWPKKNLFTMCDPSRHSMFDKVCGTDEVRLKFTKSFRVDDILDLWNRDIPAFRTKAEKYFLYD